MRRLPIAILALSLGLATACGSNSTTDPGPTPTPGDVTIVKGASLLTTAAFDPNPKQVGLGGAAEATVRWINTDGGGRYGGTAVVHQMASDNQAFATSPPLGSGASYSVSLAAGTYHFHCAIHPNMVGTITVGP
jgi:plastocyanin